MSFEIIKLRDEWLINFDRDGFDWSMFRFESRQIFYWGPLNFLQKYYISSIRQKIHFNSDIIVINNLISVEIETNNFTEKMIFHLIYQE